MAGTSEPCCVLTLHRVVDQPERDHDLSSDGFTALLDSIALRGLEVSTALDDPRAGSRSVVLTFDDATSDHLRAAEELSARGFSAIFFVPVGLLGQPSRLADVDLRRLVELGHVVGSHTVDHVRLDELDGEELRRQIVESKQRLEALASTRVDLFAPPGGSRHPRLADVLAEAGYSASRSMRWGFYDSPGQRWEIPCLPITRLTWGRGWIERALGDWELPTVMSIVWSVKQRLPRNAAVKIRGLVTR